MSTSTLSAPAVRSPVRAEHVTKRFRQGEAVVEAIKDVSLTIDDGEFVAVMGASGSGKSTLLHAMAGLTRLDEGRMVVADTDLSGLSDAKLTRFRRRKIGLVFQSFNLIPTLTAEENITLPLLTDGRGDRIKEHLDPLLDRLGLTARRRHRPDALSGGEQQRVAIARSLITDPALVLADEPTGSLDSVSGQNICRLLRELCEEQRRTIVVVTHEPAVAVWAGRVVVMKDGHVLTEFRTSDFGDAQSLALHYQNVVKATPTAKEQA
ncbi:ABC transporter ATP-binding protein [Fimbriiglobus ruber]|uniref:ABC transporter, ATP-binding protein n=1 Tax=Fimbriiglobus ruber TaxID=1908690 RepID=A0A225DHF7_9BACT|nr:ABC transporter ATP-binding protein [Fimbriiglobus ruber]OWK35815.1 ABC transporter, ATP-binding protein [Fimbriiglobus ruber]